MKLNRLLRRCLTQTISRPNERVTIGNLLLDHFRLLLNSHSVYKHCSVLQGSDKYVCVLYLFCDMCCNLLARNETTKKKVCRFHAHQ